MEEKIIERVVKFCRLLRRYGINISYSESMDALRAISEVGIDKEDFYYALKCTLIKDEANAKVFYGLFQLFFNPPNKSSKAESDRGDSLNGLKNKDLLQGETKMVESAQGVGTNANDNLNSYFKEPIHILLAKAVKSEDYKLMQFIAHKAVQDLGAIDPQRDDIKTLLKKAKENIGWDKAVSILFGPNTF